RLASLTAAGALLVDRTRGDLLRPFRRGPALLDALLDVLVLPLSLGIPCFLWHGRRMPAPRVAKRAGAGRRPRGTAARAPRAGPPPPRRSRPRCCRRTGADR